MGQPKFTKKNIGLDTKTKAMERKYENIMWILKRKLL
jgi:hypothetical protein